MRTTSTASTRMPVSSSRRAVSSSMGEPALMGQGSSPEVEAATRGLTESNPASRAMVTSSGGETSSIVRWSMPTSGVVYIPSLLISSISSRSDFVARVEGARFEFDLRTSTRLGGSRYENRFHRPAFANRLESLGGAFEQILREQGTRVYGTASQQVQSLLVVREVARVAEQQAQLSPHRESRGEAHLLGVDADHDDRPAWTDGV